MRYAVLSALLMVCCVSDATAQGRRSRRVQWQPVQNNFRIIPEVSAQPTGKECQDAIDEVNEHRARLRLPPFIRDSKLCQAAYAAARNRAQNHNAGHTSNDFAFLPDGGHATAAGCGAWMPGDGWGTCCAEGAYTHAGAAWVIGSDGRRYMHLFVR